MDKKRRAKRNFFVRLTRSKSKIEIEKIEKRLKRELTKQERKKIIKKNAAKARRRVLIGALVGVIGIGGPLLLNSGEKTTEGITVNVETNGKENENKESEKQDSAKTFRNEIAEAAKVEETEREDEEITIASEAQLLQYLKNEYIEEYEKATGDTELTTADIEMMRANQDYVMLTEDGVVVTHGATPDVVRSKLEKDGRGYSIEYEQQVYYIKEKNGDVFDGVTIMKDQEGNYKVRRVVHGDNYDKMIDSDSVACDMSRLIMNGMDGVCEWENNLYRKLAIETVQDREKYKNIETPSQVQDVQEIEDDGR